MKILIYFIVAFTFSFMSSVLGATANLPFNELTKITKTGVSMEDSLKKLDFNCIKLLIAETPKNILELKQIIDKNKSFVLVYQKDYQWLIEKDMTKSISLINISKSEKIVYCEDKIRIFGNSYPDVKYAVIMQ